jgi:AAA domain/HNH endonuclease
MARGEYIWRWEKVRKQYLQRYPLCRMCQHNGHVTAAKVVDHIVPHQGNRDPLFWDENNFQSLCLNCHNSIKKQIDIKGWARAYGVDGLPINGHQPNRIVRGFSIPHGVRKSAITVNLVCGPPASGKTTFVRNHAKENDIIIDFDDIRERICGDRYSQDQSVMRQAYRHRDVMIHRLAIADHGQAWLIVMAPTQMEQRAWKDALGNVIVHVINATATECKQRISNDPNRIKHINELHSAVDRYFASTKKEFDRGG